jgi:predicted RNA-binding protein YlxR (DUF448 family)
VAKGTGQVQRVRHVPQRTCVNCGREGDKRALIRIVRTPHNALEVDERGKKPGRGAYLCPERACWEGAIGRKRLEHAFKRPLTDEERQMLAAYADTLPAQPASRGDV